MTTWLAVKDKLHFVYVAVWQNNQLTFVNKVDLGCVAGFTCFPYKRQFIACFQLKTLRPGLHTRVQPIVATLV